MSLKSGIYCLYYELGDYQYYIGKSIDILDRYKNHCSHLKNGTHHNKHLQSKYQSTQVLPSISILEELPIDKLDLAEIRWISEFDSYYNGMNETKGGDSSYGESNPFALYSKDTYIEIAKLLAYTDLHYKDIATKLGVSDRVIGTIGTGKMHTWLNSEIPEVYDIILSKMGTRNSNTLQDTEYIQILFRLANTEDRLIDISKETGIGNRIIERISQGKSHVYLKDKYPEEYARMIAKIGTRRVKAARTIPYPDIVSPEGIVYSLTNVREFCRNNNLQQSMLGMVIRGQTKQHKGWKLA